MFKIDEEGNIKISRGDAINLLLKIPIMDTHGYIKYYDGNSTYYWYDTINQILYDTDYAKSNTQLSTLSIVYYQFKANDIITFNVYEKNGYDKDALKTKSVILSEDAYQATIPLTETETTIKDISNKPQVFWYDITLNENKTVVGYEDSAKEFTLLPAKGDDEDE